ncbi:SDR family NAD(P)-dependent oxidoreductase [Chloroflexota bacterium]
MELGLKDKVVIITGGGSNIGRGITHAFAREGSSIVIAEVNEKWGERVADEARRFGARDVLAVKTDVTSTEQVEEMVSKALGSFKEIDVLVNNVGAGTYLSLVEKSREAIAKELDLNLGSVINCTRAVLPYMVARKSGNVVNITSQAGRQGYAGLNIYSSAKAGVIGLTQALARELGGCGIRLNCVAPGRVPPADPEDRQRGETLEESLRDVEQRACIKRLGKPNDIANAVVFLASDAAGYITGQTLNVCGGLTFH